MYIQRLWAPRPPIQRELRVLLVGPYDPNCGEYTFIAPPLGVWRLKGFITTIGHRASVFDPNCCDGSVLEEFSELISNEEWDVIGISTTGMTLRYDLSLAHMARRLAPNALLIAGGMEATFNPDLMFKLAPIDLVMLGEGEMALQELLQRLVSGAPLTGIAGSAVPLKSGGTHRFHGKALAYDELRQAIASTPYAEMPYERYWKRLESAYRTDGLPFKAEREARLAEIRSVRLITLNYCPMACTFCSSTNFLHSAQGSTAKIARLTADDCLQMIKRIVHDQPGVRSIIFQDDIFVFTNDKRVTELCELIRRAKEIGDIPAELAFISTNRIDAMTEARLRDMRSVGFRVVGFGVESFSRPVLEEFNKGQIFRHIETTISTALRLGLTPFLDLILSSPKSKLSDVVTTIRESYRWIMAGCEVGIYPYVVPFSGAKMAQDPNLRQWTTHIRQHIPGTDISWAQPEHILPIDCSVRHVMERIVASYEQKLQELASGNSHLPSRVRSLLWIASAIPVLRATGANVPDASNILRKLNYMLVDACASRAVLGTPDPVNSDLSASAA